MIQFPLKNDPERKKETSKYPNAVASRTYIEDVLEVLGKPASYEELCSCFGLERDELCRHLQFRLKAMCRDGQIIQDRQQHYGLISHMNVKQGTVIGHRDGYGFVKLTEGGEDWYLSPREMSRLLPQDKVLVRIKGLNQRGRVDAGVVRVIESGKQQIVGEYFVDDGLAFVVPEDRKIPFDIYVNPDEGFKTKPGQLVAVEITKRPQSHNPAKGIIKEIIGKRMAPGMEIKIALRAFDLPFEWPDTVVDEVNQISEEVKEEDMEGRIDLRHLPFVTIDGKDARDFDDAVYAEKYLHKGWKLWVAIADVSHYVRMDSPLDEEAFNRGTSVYFPGEVIPMLPEKLSNGLCSLNPDVNRLVMVSEMEISETGQLMQYDFYPALIKSHARLTYDEVWSFLQGDVCAQIPANTKSPLSESINELYQLFKSLIKQRKQRGGIDFDTVETGFIFNQQRKIESIVPIVRNDAHKIIEECMILANIAAAQFLLEDGPIGIFRNHLGPTEQRLEKLRGYLGQLSLSLNGGSEPSPLDYSQLLSNISERDDKENIQLMLLRSLSQAVYEAENKGHFGLALDHYSHFTSPIRRYPDLLLHRLIKAKIQQSGVALKGLEYGESYSKEILIQDCDHCSLTERRAESASRDVMDWLRCEFMQEKVGLEYCGKVVSVTSFGLFIQLEEIYVEGLVHVSSLSRDYYQFDPVSNRLTGEKSGTSFGIGDVLKIRVLRVNLEERKIDFELLEILKTTHRKKTLNKFEKPHKKSKVDSSKKDKKSKNDSKHKKKTTPKKQRKIKAKNKIKRKAT